MAIDGTTRLQRFRSKESVTLTDLGTAMSWGGGGSGSIANGSVSTVKLGGDITTAGKAILDDADNTAQRVTLGLGSAATAATTAFEASGSIATHAALTSSVHGITTFGASLVDDSTAAGARSTLGVVGVGYAINSGYSL